VGNDKGFRVPIPWLSTRSEVALGGFVRHWMLDVGCWTLTALPVPTVFCRRFPGAAPWYTWCSVRNSLWLGHLRRVFLRKYLLRAHLTWSGCRPAAGHAPKSPSRTCPLGLKRLILRGRGNLAPNHQVLRNSSTFGSTRSLSSLILISYQRACRAFHRWQRWWLLVYQLSTLNHQLVGGHEPFPGSRRLCFSNIKPHFRDKILWTRHMARFILRP
jgi:hypothetical protein